MRFVRVNLYYDICYLEENLSIKYCLLIQIVLTWQETSYNIMV